MGRPLSRDAYFAKAYCLEHWLSQSDALLLEVITGTPDRGVPRDDKPGTHEASRQLDICGPASYIIVRRDSR